MNDRQMNDYGDNNNGFICGVVEGFYGKPWSFYQRKDLFKTLKEFKLNAFLYAPKDDTKHRSKWRLLYNEAEASQLKALIDEAKRNGIDFFYSLAPGLDMVYSDQKELDLLIKKFDQLAGLGCESFAILFDDIEPSISEKDREVFKNYALAQVSVSNMIFEHLKRPKFLFCPTEYCESRAVPNVTNSCYLNTLGTGLLDGIDIMWSGSRVISRFITEESIEVLTKAIRRPPVIWENLHANDYDKKRIFLGPYSGRSTKILPKLRGILTNPNCEYEANYIAIHTMAQWSRCTEDINLHNRCNPDLHYLDEKRIAFEERQQPQQISESVYHPGRALVFAIRDWLPRLMENRPLPLGVDLTTQLSERSDELASNQLVKEDEEEEDIDVEENNVDMVPEETQLSASSTISTVKSGDMDTCSSPPREANMIDANSCDSCDMQAAPSSDNNNLNSDSHNQTKDSTSLVDCVMCSIGGSKTGVEESGGEGQKVDCCETFNVDHISLLVDLFYLPFEHGSYGYLLLKDIKWLRDNSDILLFSKTLQDQQRDNDKETTKMNDDSSDQDTVNSKAVSIWLDRAEHLTTLCACINQLVNTLIHDLPNKLIIIELYPYLADMRDMISMVIDYIKFLRYRTSTVDRFYYQNSSKHKESSAPIDEQEPWVHRGGLIGDIQRFLVSS